MNQKTRPLNVPLVIAVTGHRDILPEHEDQLVRIVRHILAQLKTRLPHTGIILLSALAEGADRIAARAALEEGISLHVVLPYDESAYLNSFDAGESVTLYHELKQKASQCVILDCGSSDAKACYLNLGKFLAGTSTILIALWDGELRPENGGGTGSVVALKREGTDPDLASHCDGSAIYWVRTPRRSNPGIDNPFSLSIEIPGGMTPAEFDNCLIRQDRINRDMSGSAPSPVSLQGFMDYFERRKNHVPRSVF